MKDDHNRAPDDRARDTTARDATARDATARDATARNSDDMDVAGEDASTLDTEPPRTTTDGWFTAPKFGAAGSGGAEYEPGSKKPKSDHDEA